MLTRGNRPFLRKMSAKGYEIMKLKSFLIITLFAPIYFITEVIPALIGAGATFLAGVIGGAFSATTNESNLIEQRNINAQNLAFSREQFEYQKNIDQWNKDFSREQFEYLKGENATTRAREDTAVTRYVNDLKNAGLSRLNATGSANSTAVSAGGSTVSSGAGGNPQLSAKDRQMYDMEWLARMGEYAIDAANRKAQTALNESNTLVNQAEIRKLNKEIEILTNDYEILKRENRTTHDSRSTAGNIINDIFGSNLNTVKDKVVKEAQKAHNANKEADKNNYNENGKHKGSSGGIFDWMNSKKQGSSGWY